MAFAEERETGGMEAPIHPALFQQPEQSLWITCPTPCDCNA
jgi:hypothetical protein